MKKAVSILFLLCGLAQAQDVGYFEFKPRNSLNGRLVRNLSSVQLCQNGQVVYTLVEKANPRSTPGVYAVSNVAYGMYQVYVNGTKFTEPFFIGSDKVEKVVDVFDSAGKLTITAFPDSLLGLKQMTTATVNFIGSGGSITNNPDGTTLENKGGSTLGIHTTYLDSIRRSFEAFAGAPDSNFATLDSLGLKKAFANEQIINLKSYVGCDACGDKSAEIQQAVNAALNTTSKIVHAPGGTYEVSSTVNLENGVTIIGDGIESKFVALGTANLFSVSSDTNVTFESLSMQGSNTATSGNDGRAITGSGNSRIVIKKCTFTKFSSRAISLTNTDDSEISQNKIVMDMVDPDAFDAAGIQLYWGSDRNLISKNILISTHPYVTTLDWNTGIFIQRNIFGKPGPKYNSVTDNYIDGWNKYGIMFYASSNSVTGSMTADDTLMVGNSAIDNKIKNIGNMAIYNTGSDKSSLIANVIDSSGALLVDENLPRGAISQSAGRYCVLNGNIISNTLKFHGIAVSNSHGTTVDRNQIWNFEQDGIKVISGNMRSGGTTGGAMEDTTESYVGISNNRIFQNFHATLGNGIRVLGGNVNEMEYGINISENRIRNLAQTGILVKFAERMTINNNVIDDAGRRGIDVDEFSYGTISGNIMTNIDTATSLQAAVVVNWNSSYNRIEGNIAVNATPGKGYTYGAFIVSNTDTSNAVVGNTFVNPVNADINDLGVNTEKGEVKLSSVARVRGTQSDSISVFLTDRMVYGTRQVDGVVFWWIKGYPVDNDALEQDMEIHAREDIFFTVDVDTVVIIHEDETSGLQADNRFELRRPLQLQEQTATPKLPSTGDVLLYAKNDNKVYILDDAGVETDLTQGTGGGGGGEANTASNFAGPGEGLFKIKSGTDLVFWEVVADSNINIWTASDGVHIAASLPPDSSKIWAESATLDSAKSTHLINIRNSLVVRDTLKLEKGQIKTESDTLAIRGKDGSIMFYMIDNGSGTLLGHQLEIVAFKNSKPVVSFGVDEATTNPTGGNWRILDSGVSKSANVKALNVTGSLKVNVLAADSLRLLIEDDGISPIKLEDEVTTLYRSLTFPDTVKLSDYFEIGSLDSTLKPLRFRAITDQGTASIMLEHRGFSTLNSTGTNLLSTELIADSNGEETLTFVVDPIPAGQYVVAVIKAVSATKPTRLFLELKSQINE